MHCFDKIFADCRKYSTSQKAESVFENLTCVVLTRKIARIVESIPEGNKRKRKLISFRKSNLRCFDEKNCADLRKYSGKAETETNLLALHIVFHGDLSLRNRSEAVDRYRCH